MLDLQVEESQDMRFSYRLSAACAGDKNMFCRDVRPGSGEVLRCLAHHAAEAGFSGECPILLKRLYRSALQAKQCQHAGLTTFGGVHGAIMCGQGQVDQRGPSAMTGCPSSDMHHDA